MKIFSQSLGGSSSGSSSYAGVYSAATAYTSGQIATYYGAPFLCIQNGTGKVPLLDNDYWVPMGALGGNGRWWRRQLLGVTPATSATASLSVEANSQIYNTFSSTVGQSSQVRYNMTGGAPTFPAQGAVYRTINWSLPGLIETNLNPWNSGGGSAAFSHWFGIGKNGSAALGDLASIGGASAACAGVQFETVSSGGSFEYKLGVSINLTSGATTSGSAVVTVASTTGVQVGSIITGDNIPASTTVLSVDSSTQLTLSANASATASGKGFGCLTKTTITGHGISTSNPFKVRLAWDGNGRVQCLINGALPTSGASQTSTNLVGSNSATTAGVHLFSDFSNNSTTQGMVQFDISGHLIMAFGSV